MILPVSACLQLLGFLGIALAWLIPNHYPPWTSFYNDSSAAAGLLLLAVSVAGQRFPFGIPALASVVMTCAVIPWLQWSIGLLKFSGDVWISTLYLGGCAIAISTAYRWSRVDAAAVARNLSVAALIAALLSSVLGMMQVFEVWSLGIWIAEIFDGGRAAANLAQSNNLATLLGLGVVGVLLLSEQGGIGRVLAGTLLFVLLLALSLTQSRMSLLFGPVIWLGYWLAVRRGVLLRVSLSMIAAATGIAWTLMLAQPVLMRATLLASYESVATRGTQSLRFQVWPMLLDGLSLHPWLGYGWLQVGAAELAVADRHPPVGELYLHAHNLFLELVIWCGYPLGLCLGGGILYWFVTRLSRVSTTEGVFGMLVVSVIGVHAMFELPYHYAYFLIPLGLAAGLVEASIGSKAHMGPKWHIASTLAGGILLIAIWWDYHALEDDFRLVRFENLRIGYIQGSRSAPEAPFLSSLTEFLRFSRTYPREGMSAAELDRMRSVVERYPYAAAMARYAWALALNKRLDEARVLYTKIAHMHGDGVYRKVKRDLHQAVLADAPLLRQLEQSIP
jgi:O-antigen ligase